MRGDGYTIPERIGAYKPFRRAVVEVSPDVLLALCTMTEPTTVYVSEHALPEDAVAVGARYDALRDVWELAVESATFDEVPEGCMSPRLPPPVFVRVHPVEELPDAD